MNTEPIVVENTFNAPVAIVWKAITDKDQMRQWFFEPMTEFDPSVGFETQFSVHCEGEDFLHLWKVTEVVPETTIAYDWRYGGYPGQSTVTWELSKTSGGGARLKLTHAGHETFPKNVSAFSRENGQAGWDYLICESLKAFLEKSRP